MEIELERNVRGRVPGDMAGAQPDWAALRARWLASHDVRASFASTTPDSAGKAAQSGSFDARGARALSAFGLSLTGVNPIVSANGKPELEEAGLATVPQATDGRGS